MPATAPDTAPDATASQVPDARPLPIVITGHVDHGKSTLVGRLLHDTGALPEGRLAQVQGMSARRGMPFEWAFLLDAMQAERDQGITIDTTRIRFNTAKRGYTIIDAPGHKEFLKNMVTGAAAAEAALLLVDATQGLAEQTRRHAWLLELLGLREVAVVVTKMDLVGFAPAVFAELAAAARLHLAGLGLTPTAIVPIAARDGLNVMARADAMMPWHAGPTVTEALDAFQGVPAPVSRPLRLPVQGVYKFDERRIVAGRIAQGQLKVGDTVLVSPENKVARVASIEAWHVPAGPTAAAAGESVGLVLEPPIFLERGAVLSHADHPPALSDVFRARVFWLGAAPLVPGRRLTLRLGTAETSVTVEQVTLLADPGQDPPVGAGTGSSRPEAGSPSEIPRHGAGEVVLRAGRLLALDEAGPLARCVLVEDHVPMGGGLVDLKGWPDQRAQLTSPSTNTTAVGHAVTQAARAARNGHQGGVLWLTGLSGAGKSTLALALEARLFALGFQVYVLDGDNLRSGLNANLGFSPAERGENIRRAGEVAALFAEAGFVVVSSFISPYRADRARARAAVAARGGIGAGFHEIWVDASLATCEARDPKGLYKKARAGLIAEFTGVSSPYEPPESPELTLATDTLPVEACLERLADYVAQRFR